jgi:hypothetical protein
MNAGEIIVNMQQTLLQLEQLTRPSVNINYMEIRKLCVDMQTDANNLWSWAMDAEDEMDIADWRSMREKFKGKV